MTNFRLSISPYKYKVNNIFTQIHRTRDCSSDEEQFSIALNELRTIFAKNSYPVKLVKSKISVFFKDDKKPPRPDQINSFCLDYNNHMVDIIAKKLVRKMKNFAPDFNINTCYRSIKISNIYSYTFKPKNELMETANCVYCFECECSAKYIGQSKRLLKVRVGEHQQKARESSIYGHIIDCKEYKKKFRIFKKQNNDQNVTVKQLEAEKQRLAMTKDQIKINYFQSHFKIIQKNFRSKQHRMDAEAFFIRMHRPKLNKQEELKFFKLF